MLPNTNEHLITGVNPRDFFQEALQEAILKHHIPGRHETTLHLSNLLTVFIQADELFEQTEDGVMLKPSMPAPLMKEMQPYDVLVMLLFLFQVYFLKV